MSEAPKSSPPEGHYAKKQLGCGLALIAWSHRRRFETGLQLVTPLNAKVLLDYGSGDGTFLSMLAQQSQRPALLVGAEIDGRLVAECNQRFSQVTGLTFVEAVDLEKSEHAGRYGVIVCMEVFEHVVEVEALLEQFARWLAPGGVLLISVPVETGLPLLVKQAARRVAGWMGLGDYPGTTSYTWGELWRSVTAGSAQHIVRPVHRDASGFASHDHKGFNWRALRARIQAKFPVERTVASPVSWLTPDLASQAWFIARRPGKTPNASGSENPA